MGSCRTLLAVQPVAGLPSGAGGSSSFHLREVIMRFVARLFLLSILACSCQSFGAEPNELKYAPAVRELREYDAAVQALKKRQQQFLNLAAAKHKRELADLREQATEALEKIQDEVTKEGRLDDALAIREAIKKLGEPTENETTTPTAQVVTSDLLQQLDDTTWILQSEERKQQHFKGNTLISKVEGQPPTEKTVLPCGNDCVIAISSAYGKPRAWVQIWHFTEEGCVMSYYLKQGDHEVKQVK